MADYSNGGTNRDAGEDLSTQFPVRLTSDNIDILERDEGPLGWFMPLMEETYTRLAPRGVAIPPSPTATPASGAPFESSHQPGASESVLSPVSKSVWRERLAEYKRRKGSALSHVDAALVGPGAPFVPGERNWFPLGPSVVLDGQTVGEQPVAGHVSGLAIAPGGALLYAATASGGVFRSNDGGNSWRSLMDGFDVDPTDFASSSLACGAIAIDPANPARVYVGTGEGDTHELFRLRIVNSLPAYRGIGPIRTDDGGATWITESTEADSP